MNPYTLHLILETHPHMLDEFKAPEEKSAESADEIVKRHWSALGPEEQAKWLEVDRAFSQTIEGIPISEIFRVAVGYRESLEGAEAEVEADIEDLWTRYDERLDRILEDVPNEKIEKVIDEYSEKNFKKFWDREVKARKRLEPHWKLPSHGDVAAEIGISYGAYYKKILPQVRALMELYPVAVMPPKASKWDPRRVRPGADRRLAPLMFRTSGRIPKG